MLLEETVASVVATFSNKKSSFICILLSLVDEEKINCSFEEDFCLWRQDFDDDGDWLRVQGATIPPDTGPSFDHTTGDQSGAIKYSNNYKLSSSSALEVCSSSELYGIM